MRPIKYRAFIKEGHVLNKNKIVDVLEIDFEEKEIVFETESSENAIKMGASETVKWCTKFENIVLLEFTGLTDRNGTEIYEGDIRKVGTGRLNDLFVVTWYEKTARFNFQSLFSGATLTFDNDWNDFAKESEKVGTIFENPELVDKDMTLNVWGNING